MYILALIISSLCVAKQYERSVTERETESRREERLIPVTPLLHCRQTQLETSFLFQNVTQNVQICFRFQYK